MPKNDFLSPILQNLLYAQEHRLVDDPVGKAIVRAIDAGVADEFILKALEQRVVKHRTTQAFAGPFRLPHLAGGDLRRGRDARGQEVRMPLQGVNGHELGVGSSGSGKTIQAKSLALQIAPKVQGCWLLDLRKREFRDLALPLAKLGVDLLIVSGRELRLNPLQVPKGVLPVDWASRAADMLVHVLQLPERASKLLHVGVMTLYRELGVIDGSSNYPTLFDLRERIATAKTANPQARMAIIDSLDPVLLSLGPRVLANRVGWTSFDLSKRRILYEFDGLGETDKSLLLNFLLLSEMTSRVARGISNSQLDLWVCCDEAARMVAPSNHASNMADLIGLVRGAGIGLHLSLQTCDVAPAVLSNSATKWIGRCGSARDYDVIGSAMGLSAEQKQWAALNLRPGVFIVQLGDGPWRHPFVCHCPLIQLPRAQHDSDFSEHDTSHPVTHSLPRLTGH